MSISIELARRILEACKYRARELRSPASIAIVDAGGHLVVFERMMAPYGWATGDISIAKAYTSVMFNQSTDSVAQWATAIPGFAASLATMTAGKFIMAAGGWPIRVNGITIGGLGVSGGNAIGRDDEIARAGLAVVGPMAQAVQPAPAPYHSPWAQTPLPAAYQNMASQPVYPHEPEGNEVSPAPFNVNTSHLPANDFEKDLENNLYEAFSDTTSTVPYPEHPGGQV